MNRIVLFFVLLMTLTAHQASAEGLYGGLALKNQYVLGNLLVPTDEPVAQGWVSQSLGQHCSLIGWFSKGLSTTVGDEFDIGGTCSFDVAEETSVKIIAQRYFINNLDDIYELSATLFWLQADLQVAHYVWEKGNPDSWRADLGYTLEPTDVFSVRGGFIYEVGSGLPDIGIGSVKAAFELDKHWQISAEAKSPLIKSNRDFRSGEMIFTLGYTF